MSLNRRSIITGFAALALVALASVTLAARDDQKPAAPAHDDAPPTPAKQAFDRIAKLAGEWNGKFSDGEGMEMDADFTYRLTAGGSAVVETLFLGTPHEMVTVYHMDGDTLMLTHYCAAGNQPRMKAATPKVEDGKPLTLKFEFAGASNMKSPADGHMHEATVNLLDNDHIKSEWSFFEDNKPVHKAIIDLHRKK